MLTPLRRRAGLGSVLPVVPAPGAGPVRAPLSSPPSGSRPPALRAAPSPRPLAFFSPVPWAGRPASGLRCPALAPAACVRRPVWGPVSSFFLPLSCSPGCIWCARRDSNPPTF